MNLVKNFLNKRTIEREVVKNTFWLMLAEAVARIFAVFSAIWIARYLGVASYGKYNFAFSFVSLFVVLTDFGLSTLTIRDISRNKNLAQKYFNNILLLKLFFFFLTFSTIAIFLSYMGKTTEVKFLVYLASFAMIVQSLTQFFQSIFRAFGKMEYEALNRIIFSGFFFLITTVIIRANLGISPLVFGSLIASLVSFFTAIFFMKHKLGRFSFKFEPIFLKHLLKETQPFFLSSVFVSVYWYIGVTLLSLMKSDVIVGWYTAATNLIFVLFVIPSIVFSAVFPLSARLYKTSQRSLKHLFQKSFEYMIIIAVPLAAGTTIIADKVIDFLYGSEYGPSVSALQILIWGAMFAFMAIPIENLFSSVNRQYVLVKEFGLAALINVTLNLFLIPRYSFQGSAIAALAVWLFELVYLILCLRKTSYLPEGLYFKKVLIKVLLATIIMAASIYLFKNWHLFLIIATSVIIYFSVMILIDKKFFGHLS